MAETNNASDHSLLWGYPIEFWDRIGIRSLIWGAVLGVIALLLTAASAYILYRVADVAQKDLEDETKSSTERIAELSTQSEELRKATAEANARAAEAQLELEKYKTPRRLDDAQSGRIKSVASKFPGTPFDVTVNLESEPESFAAQIGEVLVSAGWIWKDRNNTPGLAINLGKHQAGMLNGGPPLAIEIDASKANDWEQTVLLLGNALAAEGHMPILNKANDNSASPDAIHIFVGSKR